MNRPNLTSEAFTQLTMKIGQERLRQARYSFNISLTSSVGFAAVGLLGAIMLLFGKVPEGTVVASSGMLSSVGCIRLAKDANDRLDQIMNELLDEA